MPAAGCRRLRPIRRGIPRMLIVMAVEAKQFPVAAIRRIVVMVVVFMVDREFAKPFAFKFTSTASTNRGKHFKCLLAIPLHPKLSFASSIGNELIPPIVSRSRIVRWHVLNLRIIGL